jgi:hypothetical protein
VTVAVLTVHGPRPGPGNKDHAKAEMSSAYSQWQGREKGTVTKEARAKLVIAFIDVGQLVDSST